MKMFEFRGLHSKMYAYETDKKVQKLKGTKNVH
jgi:hypothetical protein